MLDVDAPVSLFPAWPAGARVGACVSTRQGGVSQAPFDQLNLGDHVGDDPGAVAANRALWTATLGGAPVWLRQVHGVDVQRLTRSTQAQLQGVAADAAFTTEAGVACVVGVADCLPIFLAVHLDDNGGNDGQLGVAAIHAGWRGLAHGVVENTVRALCAATQARPEHLVAWLGPCIGPTAFEVGAEVHQALGGAGTGAARWVSGSREGAWMADLAGLARDRLHASGLTLNAIHGNDGSPAWCTVLQPTKYFSHRRDHGRTGRMAAAIWIKEGAQPNGFQSHQQAS